MQRAYVRTGAQGCRNQSQPQNGVMVRLPSVLQASGGAGWLHVRTAQQQQQEQVESAIGPSHRHDRGAPWSALTTPQSSPVVGQAEGAQPVTP
jgi:hypothetical protein